MSLAKVFFVILLMCFGWAKAAALEPVTLQLKWQHQWQFAGYYAAQKLGYFEDAGFDVTLRSRDGSEDLFKPVREGEATFGVADSSLVLRRLLGEDLVVLTTVFQHSPLVLITLAEDNILSPYELIGKRVMVESGVDDAAVVAMFASLNIPADRFEQVPHNFNTFALLDDDIDAMVGYSTDQPHQYQERGIDVRIIDPSNYGIDFYGDLLYASQDYVEAFPERAKEFADATIRGWEYAVANPDEISRWIIEQYNPNVSMDQLTFEAEKSITMIAANYIELGTMYDARFERIADIYKQLRMAPQSAQLDGLTLPHYLRTPEKQTAFWIKIIASVSFILIVIVLVMLAVNRRLQQTVKSRTRELNELNYDLQRQLQVIDQYVMSVETDLAGTIVQVSDAFCRISGYEKDELIGANISLLRHPDQSADVFQQMWKVLMNRQSWHGELKNQHQDGSAFYVEMNIDPIIGSEANTIKGYSAVSTDISYRKLLLSLSETDSLTGLPNRYKLDRCLAEEWQRYQRYQTIFSVIIFDIDNFKKINDQYGHLEGDKVLKAISDIASQSIRRIDTVGRWGGEEFLIVCPGTDMEGARQMAEKLRQAIANISVIPQYQVTSSFGVVSVASHYEKVDTILGLADEALYFAKTEGKNRVEVID
ncbi:diguanylate cyclase [Reinekea sp. G2M2-21]|uniref:diguanylate cyclase n=1 Tax=Reinekea sp. G2M2-21 TaxID=2788942 RepID=UPI0018AAD5CF|nr:diguanylate cyclase [Reinekea sp. G2M2-21]